MGKIGSRGSRGKRDFLFGNFHEADAHEKYDLPRNNWMVDRHHERKQPVINEEILGLRGGALPKRRSTALRPVRRFGGRRARVQFPAEPAITLVTNRPGDLRAPSTWFHYFDPAAREVFVAGDFNNWNPAATPMFRSAGGEWSAQIDLPPGAYEYRFVADGVWKTDPKAESKANGFGEQNSIKRVQAV